MATKKTFEHDVANLRMASTEFTRDFYKSHVALVPLKERVQAETKVKTLRIAQVGIGVVTLFGAPALAVGLAGVSMVTLGVTMTLYAAGFFIPAIVADRGSHRAYLKALQATRPPLAGAQSGGASSTAVPLRME